MTDKERIRLIDNIIWGKIIVNEKNPQGQSLHFVLDVPTAEIKARSSFVYESAYESAIDNGLSTEGELIDQYVEWGQWDPNIDLEIDGIRKDLHQMRKGILDYFLNTTKLEHIRQTIRNAERAIIQRLTKRYNLTRNSAESYGLLQQQNFVISKITRRADGNLVWANVDDFNNTSDMYLVHRLLSIFFEESRIPVVVIRELARTNPWRSIWVSSKQCHNLFSEIPCNWSDAQKDLVYWSHVYDTVYDAYERPCKEIIEDDDLLDSWFLRQADKIEKRANEDSIKQPGKNGSKIKSGRQEQFILTDEKGASKVYDMNDSMARTNIKAKQKIIKRFGKVKEQHMPDSQQEMRQMAMERLRKQAKNRG